VSQPGGQAWPVLREAANAFCPPYEVVDERPGELSLLLRRVPQDEEEIRLRYRSTRGLFLRSFNLLVESSVEGDGPAEPGVLIRRGRRLVWKRPKPAGGKRWSERLVGEEFRAAVKHLQAERLTLAWDPAQARWRVTLETLSGGLTVTFFPPLATPNPLERAEAQAFQDLLEAVRSGSRR
jgi:hypothetical protein